MRLNSGEKAPCFDAIDFKGVELSIDDFKGRKLLLSFFRYAACPFCNLRILSMIEKSAELENKGLEIVCVFQSPSASIQKYAGKLNPPFPIVADPGMQLYKMYAVEVSFWSFAKMMFRLKDLVATIRNGLFKIFPEGPVARVPADFLINEKGIIELAYYGKDSGDHIPFKQIEKWLINKN